MKRNINFFLMALLLVTGLASCSNDDEKAPDENLPEGITNMGIRLSVKYGSGSGLKASDDIPYNPMGNYAGFTEINTLDIYLLSSDGTTLIQSKRFLKSDLSFSYDTDGGDMITLLTPFKTTPGNRKMIVIINSPSALMTTVPPDDYRYILSSSLPLASLARISTNPPTTTPAGPVYSDILVLTGKSDVFTLDYAVTPQEVTSPLNPKNLVSLDVIRVPSRAIVTTVASPNVVDVNGVTLGTISNVTYSIGQGANSVYMFPQTNPNTSTHTWGFDYLPGTDYLSTSAEYYDYSDLHNTADAVPTDPAAGNFIFLPGKFLLENTHVSGPNISISNYRKGNTAYVLIRGTFTPAPAMIADGGTLVNGTFYVGGTDGKIYSSIANAQDIVIGQHNQPVSIHTNGKVLYYAWLNPGPGPDLNKPVNSPVIRNNIYYVKINSFKRIGVSWNPLNPDVNNPDPNPNVNLEPENPIRPTDPLTTTDTYMSVDVKVLTWTVHGYTVDL